MLPQLGVQGELGALVSESLGLGRFVHKSDVAVCIERDLSALGVRDRLRGTHKRVASLHCAERSWIHGQFGLPKDHRRLHSLGKLVLNLLLPFSAARWWAEEVVRSSSPPVSVVFSVESGVELAHRAYFALGCQEHGR